MFRGCVQRHAISASTEWPLPLGEKNYSLIDTEVVGIDYAAGDHEGIEIVRGQRGKISIRRHHNVFLRVVVDCLYRFPLDVSMN
jgi:hypothetical protein